MHRKLIGRNLAGQFLWLCVGVTLACRPPAEGEGSAGVTLPAFDGIFEHCRSSVVNISAQRSLPPQAMNFSLRQQRLLQAIISSLGSGFVFERAGQILTCASILEGAEEISVVLASGRRLPARLTASLPQADLALLEIDAGLSPPPLPVGDSARLRCGQWVASFGYPYGLSHSLTAGMLSAVLPADASHPGHGLLLFDAAIHPGSNGGPLVNVAGEVIGVNLVAGDRSTTLSQAIPVNDVRQLLREPPAGGGWLGLTVHRPTREESARWGPVAAIIGEVVADGPAARAGARAGEAVLEFNGRPLASLEQLLEAAAALAPGEACSLLVQGEQGRRLLRIEAGRRPAGLTPAAER